MEEWMRNVFKHLLASIRVQIIPRVEYTRRSPRDSSITSQQMCTVSAAVLGFLSSSHYPVLSTTAKTNPAVRRRYALLDLPET
jgi:hypothetical protein